MYEGIQELPKTEKTPDFDYEGELNEFLDEREKNLIG